jgi:hypothetical protein
MNLRAVLRRRCQATAKTTGVRCRHAPRAGRPYCAAHDPRWRWLDRWCSYVLAGGVVPWQLEANA